MIWTRQTGLLNKYIGRSPLVNFCDACGETVIYVAEIETWSIASKYSTHIHAWSKIFHVAYSADTNVKLNDNDNHNRSQQKDLATMNHMRYGWKTSRSKTPKLRPNLFLCRWITKLWAIIWLLNKLSSHHGNAILSANVEKVTEFSKEKQQVSVPLYYQHDTKFRKITLMRFQRVSKLNRTAWTVAPTHHET